MDVTEAVDSRKSIRAFLDKAVDDSLIKELLEKASRAASGGNLHKLIEKKGPILILYFKVLFNYLTNQEAAGL